jgi:iron uptake system EfeUOB component EfeO/EfeM
MPIRRRLLGAGALVVALAFGSAGVIWISTHPGTPPSGTAAPSGTAGEPAASQAIGGDTILTVSVPGNQYSRLALASNGKVDAGPAGAEVLSADRSGSQASTLSYTLPANSIPPSDILRSVDVRICGAASGDFWESYGPTGSAPREYERMAPGADGCWTFTKGSGADTTVVVGVRLASTMTIDRVDYVLTVVPPRPLTVNDSGCPADWSAPIAGASLFAITNAGSRGYDVELMGPDRSTIYAENEYVAPGTTASLGVNLAPGPYLWACLAEGVPATYSALETVTGDGLPGALGFVPVTAAELDAAVDGYRATVAAGLATLAADTDRLVAALPAGDVTTARKLWLVAHMDYERLGAAYGTFGKFDARINGGPWGLPGGMHDPSFAGFLRLELGLWGGESLESLVAVGDRLRRDVHDLIAAFPDLETDPAELPLRAHEILENTLEFELTGATDMGSHTGLATARANVDGTAAVLEALRSLLATHEAGLLTTVDAGLARLTRLLDSLHRADGRWAPMSELTLGERQSLDGAVGGLLETLAPIPDLLELPPIAK